MSIRFPLSTNVATLIALTLPEPRSDPLCPNVAELVPDVSNNPRITPLCPNVAVDSALMNPVA